MRLSTILRLGLINVAVALTAVPIDGTLNRVMISEMNLPASLVALLIALPYLFSPLQVWIGGYADSHPVMGLRRTPYIVLGLGLCVAGSALSPTAAAALASDIWGGLPLGLLAFGAWGMGFNFATVSYLALATELSGEQHRARTIGVMWFMLIVGVIIAGISISRSLPDAGYDEAALRRAFYSVAAIALTVGLLALVRLEPRNAAPAPSERRTLGQMLRVIGGAPQARRFFIYLILLLVAILGQDVLLEPYAADVFGVPIAETTRYTSIWGAALLVGLLVTSPLARRVGKPRAAGAGGALVTLGLLLIAGSGLLGARGLLIPSLVVFGFGSGISTAANLALMLDMTVAGQVGLFVGAWGMADALARLLGTLLSGVVRDLVNQVSATKLLGYVVVFVIQAVAMGVSLAMIPRLSTARFQAEAATPSTRELIELAGEARGP
jgi:MFS transporter, BCD family, chlorophyll transporter